MNLSQEILKNLNQKKLLESANVGTTEDNFNVYIRTDVIAEAPYFVYSAPDENAFYTYIRIDVAEYYGDYLVSALSHKQREKLVELLKEPDLVEPKKTKWQVLLIEWNRNNPNHMIDINLKMPDYINL